VAWRFGRECIILAAVPACGEIVTSVGEELPIEAGPDHVTIADAAPTCPEDLSDTGTKDFHISFGITSLQNEFAALLNQRSACAHAVYWDIRMTTGGLLAVETDDGVNYTPLTSVGARVNDGRPHEVVVQRKAAILTVFVDGAPSGSAPSLASLARLAPLQVGTDACTAAIDGTMTFVGTITNVCVASP
jgi:hypothetical protein